MTVINNVPRELLERVLYLMDNYIGTTHTEEDELRALLSAPSPAGGGGLEVVAWRIGFPNNAGYKVYEQRQPWAYERYGVPSVIVYEVQELCHLSDALTQIACLEGEIAKRDEELAACRVAVENCEVFRARIVELEEKLAVDDDANFNLRGLLQRGAFALDLDPENTSWFEVIGELEKQSAGFAAIKAQEPVEYQLRALIRDVTNIPEAGYYMPQSWHDQVIALSLSGKLDAPVSEAKAQGVVQWPNADEIMQMAFEEGQPADDASGYYFELEEFDLFIERLMSEVARLNAAPVSEAKAHGNYAPASVVWIDAHHVIEGNNPSFIKDVALVSAERTSETQIPLARLNAAPVQQVSVPDVSAMARILADRNADAYNVNREDNWAIYGQDYIDDVTAMLSAAPAAPAADALVEALEHARLFIVNGIDLGFIQMPEAGTPDPAHETLPMIEAALAAHRSKGVV